MPNSLPAAHARYVWYDDAGEGRNAFAIFLRRLHFPDAPPTFFIHLFADSLYRLRVNGVIVGYGPARFLPAHPEHDSYDLAPWLRAGDNTIVVEVNSRGAPCFQAIQSRGGFIAWGGDRANEVGTPGDWLVHRSRAWDRHAEPFSFAQGPVEILDTRELPAGYPVCLEAGAGEEWAAPTVIANQGRWGALVPRTFAGPSMKVMKPRKIVTTAAIRNGHMRHGFNAGNIITRRRQPFFTHIYSPCRQEVELGVFWGPLWLNGQPLQHINCLERGNRQNTTVMLQEGWNFLYGAPELLRACWTWLMELPAELGLLLSALPGDEAEAAFALGPLQDGGELPPTTAPAKVGDVSNFPRDWRLIPGAHVSSPARELAWDVPHAKWENEAGYHDEIVLTPADGAATLVLDMGGEYLGHAGVEFATGSGATVDIGYDERLRADGTLAYFTCNPFINAADRFLCGAGPQFISAFHERGGRYVQITFREVSGPVLVRRVSVIQTVGDYPAQGSFRCSDPVFDWTWRAGVATLRASMCDGWIDPWRERGMYVGDTIVQAAASRKFNRDTRLEAWAIRLWAHGQFADGQIPDVVPSSHETPLCDYSLIWILLLRNYWAATGDKSLVREVWSSIGRVLSSPIWKSSDSGLWEVHEECHVFVDWGRAPDERVGVNTVLNAFRVRALECAAELAFAIGLAGEAELYQQEARTVRTAFTNTLWDQERGRFAACRLDGELSPGPALHGNALALAYGLATPAQEERIVAYLRSRLRDNLQLPEGWMNVYFLYYLFPGLYEAGAADLAEEIIRSHYGLMKDRGAWTLWESLATGMEGKGSLCHGWACSPLVVFSERVLGVREVRPGDDTHLLIAPESATLEWAEGEAPHRLGVIRVSWRIVADGLRLQVGAPSGVRLLIRPAGRLATYPLLVERPDSNAARQESLAESVR